MQVAWLSEQLTKSDLLVPATLLDGSSKPRPPPQPADPTVESPAPSSPDASPVTFDVPPAGSDRAFALGRLEKALGEMMTRLQRLTETVVALEALMRQLVGV